MRSYNDGRWLLDKDSQMNRLADWVEALPEDWKWMVLIPKEIQTAGDPRILTSLNVDGWEMPWPGNVLLARYHFDANRIKEAIQWFEPELILTEVPELARNYKAVLKMLGKEIPVVSLCIHLDDGSDDWSYTPRQWDGLYCSDLFAFQLEGTRRQFFGGIEESSTHTRIWNALYSPREVEAALDVDLIAEFEATVKKMPVVFFTARLSDNDRTRYEEFFKACRILEDRGVEFDLWVANPNKAKPNEWIERQLRTKTPLIIEPTRPDYLEALWLADIVPILWDQSRIHSRSFCEAIEANNLILTAGGGIFDAPFTRLYDESEPLLIAAVLEKMIEKLSDHVAVTDVLEGQRAWLRKERYVESNIHKVRGDLEGLVRVHA